MQKLDLIERKELAQLCLNFILEIVQYYDIFLFQSEAIWTILEHKLKVFTKNLASIDTLWKHMFIVLTLFQYKKVIQQPPAAIIRKIPLEMAATL